MNAHFYGDKWNSLYCITGQYIPRVAKDIKRSKQIVVLNDVYAKVTEYYGIDNKLGYVVIFCLPDNQEKKIKASRYYPTLRKAKRYYPTLRKAKRAAYLWVILNHCVPSANGGL